ncbi:MAG: hypothetical protein EBR40_06460 [Proteobacteria bacterium]|nr:hypothetical protein [Pseudomonadota bacterium]
MNDKPLIGSGSFGSNKPDKQWDERWGRFSQGLLARGVVAGKHDFLSNWMRKFIGFVKLRRWDQARRDNVEQFLELLVREGKAVWQVVQASKALELFFWEVGPMD